MSQYRMSRSQELFTRKELLTMLPDMTSTATGPIERFTHLILDLDYGDEQERLRYYETYAIAVHLQLITLPLIGAAVIAGTGPSATGPVIAMLGTAFAGITFGLSHLRRHNVPVEAIAMAKRNRGYQATYVLAFMTLVAAVVVRGSGPGFERYLGTGAALGFTLGIAGLARQVHRQRGVDHAAEPES